MMHAMYSIETGEAAKAGLDVSDIDLPARAANLFVAGTDALNRGGRQDAERSLAALRNLQSSAAADDSHRGHVYQGDVQAVAPADGDGALGRTDAAWRALEQLAAEYEERAQFLEQQAGLQPGRAGLSTKACAQASRMASVSSP